MLPLYSTLPPQQQQRIFEAVSMGCGGEGRGASARRDLCPCHRVTAWGSKGKWETAGAAG